MKESTFIQRVAAAPISWGVCEVPGWGHQLSPEQVLAEMNSLGFTATELGSAGWLPEEPDALNHLLASHDLGLLGAFIPLVLHDPAQAADSKKDIEEAAELLNKCGATYFINAPVMTKEWGPRRPLQEDEWAHMAQMMEHIEQVCVERGLQHVIHEHHGIAIETKADVEKLMGISDVKFVLDTGHLEIGGYDPLAFAKQFPERVGLVHLKDAQKQLIKALQCEEVTLMEAVKQGIFNPLGEGELPVAETVTFLEQWGYRGWYVIEQDCVIDPATGESPIGDVKKSFDYLRSLQL